MTACDLCPFRGCDDCPHPGGHPDQMDLLEELE